MNQYPLNLAISVILDASGNGTVQLGPSVGQRWQLNNAAVGTSTAVKIPTCILYMGGSPTAPNQVDSTYTGSQDASGKVDAYPLTNGQKIFAVWSGGDVGARATLSLFGVVETDYRNG
jgi:hypothetical protein